MGLTPLIPPKIMYASKLDRSHIHDSTIVSPLYSDDAMPTAFETP